MDPKNPKLTPTEKPACRHVKQLISDMRSDKYLAIRLDEFAKIINDVVAISEEEVRECLKHDVSVKIINDVLWLWGDSYMHMLITEIVDMTHKYGGVLAEAEKYSQPE